jgi:hypothetical protein
MFILLGLRGIELSFFVFKDTVFVQMLFVFIFDRIFKAFNGTPKSLPAFFSFEVPKMTTTTTSKINQCVIEKLPMRISFD